MEFARPGGSFSRLRAGFPLEEPLEFVTGSQDIIAFLTRKWTKELDYRLIKELWTFTGNRIAVRFAYEWHEDS